MFCHVKIVTQLKQNKKIHIQICLCNGCVVITSVLQIPWHVLLDAKFIGSLFETNSTRYLRNHKFCFHRYSFVAFQAMYFDPLLLFGATPEIFHHFVRGLEIQNAIPPVSKSMHPQQSAIDMLAEMYVKWNNKISTLQLILLPKKKIVLFELLLKTMYFLPHKEWPPHQFWHVTHDSDAWGANLISMLIIHHLHKSL